MRELAVGAEARRRDSAVLARRAMRRRRSRPAHPLNQIRESGTYLKTAGSVTVDEPHPHVCRYIFQIVNSQGDTQWTRRTAGRRTNAVPPRSFVLGGHLALDSYLSGAPTRFCCPRDRRMDVTIKNTNCIDGNYMYSSGYCR